MANKYDYGIYRGISFNYNFKDKDKNIQDYLKYMFIRSMAMFKWHNLPDTIPQKELERILQMYGYALIIKHDNQLYVTDAGLGGEVDVYRRPTKANVTIPALNLNKEYTLGKDCLLVLNDDMGQGLMSIYARYSSLLVETDLTALMSLINKRADSVIIANDDVTVESARVFIEKLAQGETNIIMENSLFEGIKILPKQEQAQKLDELYQFSQYLKASMYNEIGLNANYNMKKERLISDEVNNTDSIYPLIDNMYMNRLQACNDIETIFGAKIEVEFNSSWDSRIKQGEPIDTKGESIDTKGEPIDTKGEIKEDDND